MPRTPLEVKLVTPCNDVSRSWNHILIKWPGGNPETHVGCFAAVIPRLINHRVRSNDVHINVPFNILFTINQSKCQAVAGVDTIIGPHIQG